MKSQKIIVAFVLASFLLISCKEEVKKTENNTEVVAQNTKKLNLAISGMTCEIGCARTIASKLSKKEGIVTAKVNFKDSLATISYDADKISKKEIMSFVEGIAGGGLYKVSETDKEIKSCDKKGFDKMDCKKGAKCDHKNKKECKKTAGDKKSCDKTAADCKGKKNCTKGAECDHKDKKS